MALSILNNIAALYAQNNINSTQSNLQKTLQQLSSGSRINSGADDPSGLAVSDGMGANVAALTQSSTNATAGIGLLQTADGALSQVTSLLDQAVTLATEASNGTLTAGQVSSANQEYQNILTQIGNIGATTNFNSNRVFTNSATNLVVTDGTESGTNTYSDTIGVLNTASVGTTAGITTPGNPAATGSVTNSSTTTTGDATHATVNTFTFTAGQEVTGTMGYTSAAGGSGGSGSTGTVDLGSTPLTLSEAAAKLNSDTGFSTKAGLHADASGNTLTITATAVGVNVVSTTSTSLNTYVAATPSTTTVAAGSDFTQTGVSTLTAATAGAILTTVTQAVADVAFQRGTIGADINELTSAAGVASSESVNLSSAQDSITATDYGQAASNLSKYQILSQTGISALAQANSVQQEVLKLLQ
jgi:flagellin